MTEWEPVIGLEVHAQLQTRTKLFCSCRTTYGAAPNANVCPVCLGLPGALPVMNAEALRHAVRVGLALGCAIREKSIFARKNYFYPDLPKGYQISQYDAPICEHGRLDFEVDGAKTSTRILRAHIEEDAGKSVHGATGDSHVDLNRAGVPLVEIVSEPDLRSSAEAAQYMRALRDVLVFVGANDGNLEEGSLRCDANVSLRPRGQEALGTRTEIKNLNSFRYVARAIDTEIARQAAVLDAGGTIDQETRSYDPDTNTTAVLRGKEDAHDYRYFPDPDLPPLIVDRAFVEAERAALPELPAAARERWVRELGLTPSDAATLTGHPAYARAFDRAVALLGADPALARRAANLFLTEVLRGATTHGLGAHLPISPAQLAELVRLIDGGQISGKQAKEVIGAVSGTERMPKDIVRERGLSMVSSDAELEPACKKVVEASPKQVEQYRGGRKGILGYFVGQVMKETGGAADPKLVSEILTRLLAGGD